MFEWRPISTAPEGVTVLVFVPDQQMESRIHAAEYSYGHWGEVPNHEGYPMYCRPTHWMPLPEPPND